jgi:hypothetical protein
VCSRILSGAEMTETGGVIGWRVSLGRFSARWAPESWDTRECAAGRSRLSGGGWGILRQSGKLERRGSGVFLGSWKGFPSHDSFLWPRKSDQLRITLGESNEIFDRGKGIYVKQTPDIERSIPSR